MRILKVINNNVVSAIDDRGTEYILMGKGIGFQKKTKDLVWVKDAEKKFTLEKKSQNSGADLLFQQIPMEYMQVTGDFMAYVESRFQRPIDYGIYVAVACHIYEACKRVREGKIIKNELLLDTMNTYPKEYALAAKALAMVKEKLGIELPRDEAGFIAIHLVNLRLHDEPKKDQIREFTDRVLEMIQKECGISFLEITPTYERFLNHLHYLGRRIYEEKSFGEAKEDDFYRQVAHKYKEGWNCASQILDFIREDTGITLPDDEVMYLTIYIQRILLEEK